MEEGKFYHIYNRTNNYEKLFLNRENYLFFLRKYKHYLLKHVETHAYCLMPTHFHLLVRIKETEGNNDISEPIDGSPPPLSSLEKAFKNFFISYVKSFNKVYGRHGSLFQPKYKKKCVEDDEHYTNVISYIHLNPVKAKLCSTPSDWPYSSYTAILDEYPTQVERKAILEHFGNKKAFIDFHSVSREYSSIHEYLFDQ